MGGLATPAMMLIPAGITGYYPEIATRPPYDPERARALLAEAGYGSGFTVTLDCPTGWSLLQEEKVCRALSRSFKDIGVDVSLAFQTTGPFMTKYNNRGSDFYIDGMGAMFDSQLNLNYYIHSKGSRNFTGYANPEVDDLITRAGREMVTYGRDILLERVWRIVMDDLPYLPLYHGVVVWPMREGLDLPADPWQRPRFRHARFRAAND
jgi:peptide/nickel transport system substrate-binding protein